MKKLLLTGLLSIGMSLAAHAIPITGGISFTGGYTPENAGGSAVVDLNNATKIAFGPTEVGLAGTSGSFTVIPDHTSVTMFTPLVISPSTLPGSALWTVSSGGNTFTFTLTAMNVGPVVGALPGTQSITITGNGTLAETAGSLGYTPTDGSFTATFNGGGATFSWSASTSAVPDGGMTAALLGASLLGLAGVRKLQAKRTV